MNLSIVIPTVEGREKWLNNSLAAFERTDPDAEVIVIRNKPTCGIAWNEGIEQATGDYILLSADDIEPANVFYLDAGMYWANKGYLPCARILNTDGSLQTCGNGPVEAETGQYCEFARIPFGTAEQVRAIYPILETHYATDMWFSYRGRILGWPTVVVREFCFYHHYANVGRVDDRLDEDMKVYYKNTDRKLRGKVYLGPVKSS